MCGAKGVRATAEGWSYTGRCDDRITAVGGWLVIGEAGTEFGVDAATLWRAMQSAGLQQESFRAFIPIDENLLDPLDDFVFGYLARISARSRGRESSLRIPTSRSAPSALQTRV